MVYLRCRRYGWNFDVAHTAVGFANARWTLLDSSEAKRVERGCLAACCPDSWLPASVQCKLSPFASSEARPFPARRTCAAPAAREESGSRSGVTQLCLRGRPLALSLSRVWVRLWCLPCCSLLTDSFYPSVMDNLITNTATKILPLYNHKGLSEVAPAASPVSDVALGPWVKALPLLGPCTCTVPAEDGDSSVLSH